MKKIDVAIVEDEGIVALDIKKSLQFFGYNVAFVTDTGEKAISMLKENKADIVLMDIVLKGKMDGIEAAKHIINDMSIPIIFLTAYEDEFTKKKTKILHNCGYLVKPFEESHLKKIIEKCIMNFLTPVAEY